MWKYKNAIIFERRTIFMNEEQLKKHILRGGLCADVLIRYVSNVTMIFAKLMVVLAENIELLTFSKSCLKRTNKIRILSGDKYENYSRRKNCSC